MTSSSTQDELRRTQQYLAEVIDECVFVERQRELMERRLTAQTDNQRGLLEHAFGALELASSYTALLEDAVLQSILAALPSTSARRQSLLRARADLEAKLRQLDRRAERQGNRSVGLPPLTQHVGAGHASANSDASELPSSSLLLSPAPPATINAGADAMRELLRRKGDLLDALSSAAATLNAMQLSASSEQGELVSLRKRMDELTRLVETSAATPAGGGPPATVAALPAASPSAASGGALVTSRVPPSSPSAIRFAQARVLAYEKTVQALNNELALLHENYAALSRASALEMDRLKQKCFDAQRKHDDQVAECDAVLGRLSLELEQLIQENAQLKQKMRVIVEATE